MARRAPITFTSGGTHTGSKIEFPVLLFFDRETIDNRTIIGPRYGGLVTVRLPIPIMLMMQPSNGLGHAGAQPSGAVTRLVIHDDHIEGSGFLKNPTGPVWPGVDLDVVEHKAWGKTVPGFRVTRFTLAAVTLHSSATDTRVWPELPDALIRALV